MTVPGDAASAGHELAWWRFGDAVVRSLAASARGAVDGPTAAEVRARRIELQASLDEPTTFATIVANARLTVDDAEVFAVLAAAEFDPELHHEVAAVQRDAAKNRLTIGTLMRAVAELAGHRGVLAVAPDAPLRVSALVDVVADGPWSDHVVAVHPSVLWALAGDVSRDPDLPAVRSTPIAPDPSGAPFTVVAGPDRARRRTCAVERTAGTRFLVVGAPADRAGWSAVVREATLTGAGVVVEVDDPPLGSEGRRWIERAVHLPWAISSTNELPIEDLPDRPWTGVAAPAGAPTDEEWRAAFGDDVARTHPLKAAHLVPVARAFHALDRDLDAAVRRLVSGRLESLARRIRPTRTWADLVVSPDRAATLRSIVERYQHAQQVFTEWGFSNAASTGTVALFSGPSGTGKTLATEVVAGELGLDVFKLDLSSVVSKYIGETEKNLEQVFDAASAGNLVLFFDEADALFGKRSEVKDARDRYANIEVSYLLQRLEAYDGLVVMATNFEKNVDDAFLRRIHVRLDFALPGPVERRQIWRQNIPARAPVGEVDLDWIADRFEISGGLIRNAAVHAGFLAAASGAPITTESLVLGIGREYRKLGRLLKPEVFGPHFAAVVAAGDVGR